MQTRQCHILCADDNDDTCFMLTTLLQGEGYEVSSADSIAAAKRAVSSGRFDLTILDNRFADGSGISLCQWVREQDQDLPIIIYSGTAFQHDKAESICAGATTYVAKPDIDGLLAAVKGLLQGKECKAVSAS
jgi:DNA-binding response OmpR family regulator